MAMQFQGARRSAFASSAFASTVVFDGTRATPTRVTRKGACSDSSDSKSHAMSHAAVAASRLTMTGRNSDATTTPSVTSSGAPPPAGCASSSMKLASAARAAASASPDLGDFCIGGDRASHSPSELGDRGRSSASGASSRASRRSAAVWKLRLWTLIVSVASSDASSSSSSSSSAMVAAKASKSDTPAPAGLATALAAVRVALGGGSLETALTDLRA
mmetsp:Transcript_32311/g.113675  ORF Transcript_32311/g.113675 Transcript_32311/m.113675 type:complete len:217 (-) Transcript_32311:1425-2075(-)